jgi:CelD/BcsL family acetyltransferase involved in cellulose biosynthesis
LNARSRRHNPFLSAGFLSCYALHAEYHTRTGEERLYLIKDRDERLIGIAPMRRSLERVGPSLKGVRLSVWAPLDTERPGILCAPEDEARVANALVAHLCSEERDWGLLEFVGQLPGTPLYEALHAVTSPAFRSRNIEVEPYTEIAVGWKDVNAYFRSLAKKMRSNISRQTRRLFAAGSVEIVLAEGAEATSAWFDAYCDLDSRSWKRGTASSIERDARRVTFYREIAAGRGGLDPSFIGVLLDGVLIAGLMVGSNSAASPAHHGAWCLEMAYDQSRAELGPGQLLLLLAMAEAIRRGDRFLNYMQNFAYYKHRWGADPINVVNVQLLRVASLHNLRALMGEWRNKLRKRAAGDGPAEAAEDGEAAGGRVAAATDLSRARELAERALHTPAPGLRRLDREHAARHLPFDIER